MIKYVFFLLLIGGGSYFLYQNKEKIMNEFNPPKPTDVQVLTDSNFDQFIQQNDYVLVKFYAPWCGHCKSLAPEFESAATTLKEQQKNVILAKVDATVEKQLASKYEIKGFPTLFFFAKGEKQEYNGGRSAALILKWIDRKTGNFSTLVESVEQLNELQSNSKVLVTIYVENEESTQWQQFKEYGMSNDNYSFAHTFSQSVAQNLQLQAGQLSIFTKFNEESVVYTGSLETEVLDQYLLATRIPLSLHFGDQFIELIFQSGLPTFHFFFEESISDEQLSLIETTSQHFKDLKKNIIFSYITKSDAHFDKLAQFLGAKTDSYPQAILSGIDGRKVNKYQFEQEFNQQNLTSFVQNYFDGQLKPILKSEDIPTENNEPVRVVVGKSFQQEVINNDKDVLVKYYAAWCGHCKNLAPHWDAAAEALQNNKNIVIAKMDATLNEVDGLEVSSFPTIKFYPGNDKTNVINYTGERNKDGIINWLEKNTTHQWVPLEGQQANTNVGDL